jgi:hypothetical protein
MKVSAPPLGLAAYQPVEVLAVGIRCDHSEQERRE